MFFTDKLLDSIVQEKDRYATSYMEKEIAAYRLPPKSRFRSLSADGHYTSD